jgi:ribose transport system permease protein
MSATTQRLPRFAAAAAQMGAGVFAPGVELVRLGQFAQRSGIYLVLIALLLVPALWLPEYRNVLNLGQIVQQSAALAILAIGQTFVIACRMIDLSVGQLMGLIVVASAASWRAGRRRRSPQSCLRSRSASPSARSTAFSTIVCASTASS